MDKDRIFQELNFLFKKMNYLPSYEFLLRTYGKDGLQNLQNEIYQLIYVGKQDIQIHILEKKKYFNEVLLTTDIGHFILKNKELGIFDDSYSLIDFYCLLSSEHSFRQDSFSLYEKIEVEFFYSYLSAYYWYCMIIDELRYQQLFQILNSNYSRFYHCLYPENLISLECLENQHFHCYLSSINSSFLTSILDKYFNLSVCQVKINSYLHFIFAIFYFDQKSLSYIQKNIDEFKNFILQKEKTGLYIEKIYSFLKKTCLIQHFNQNELISLYKQNPTFFYQNDWDKFLPIAQLIKNDSPMIRLNKDDFSVHLVYQTYDLFRDMPIEILLSSMKEDKEYSFLFYFLSFNSTIVKLYHMYYKSYKKNISDYLELDNIEDFLRCLFKKNNLLKIYDNNKVSCEDIYVLSCFKDYFGEELDNIIDEVKCLSRKKGVQIYNQMLFFEQNNQLSNLERDTTFNFVVNSKSLSSREKGKIFKILKSYYGCFMRNFDVLSLLDEMKRREISLDKVLKEKCISKKYFDSSYQILIENYSMVWDKFSKIDNPLEREIFLKEVQLIDKILANDFNFDLMNREVFSFERLLFDFQNTELYDKLLTVYYSKVGNNVLVKEKKN